MTAQESRPPLAQHLARRLEGWPTLFSRDLSESLAARGKPTHTLATELAQRSARSSQLPSGWTEPLLQRPIVVTGQHEATDFGRGRTDLVGPEPDTATAAIPTVRARPVSARPASTVPFELAPSTVVASTAAQPIVVQARNGKTGTTPPQTSGPTTSPLHVGSRVQAAPQARSDERTSASPPSTRVGEPLPPTQTPPATTVPMSPKLPVFPSAAATLQPRAAPKPCPCPTCRPHPLCRCRRRPSASGRQT